MIKLIIIDLDGTLIGGSRTIHTRDKLTIQSFLKNGGMVSICTGRYSKSGQLAAKHLNLTTACIYNNGAIIMDPQNEEILYSQSIKAKHLHPLALELQKNSLEFELYTTNNYYSTKMTSRISKHAKQLGLLPEHQEILPKIEPLSTTFSQNKTFIKANILTEGPKEKTTVKKIYQKYQNKLRFDHALGHDPKKSKDFWNVTNPNVHKGTAVKKLLQLLKLDQSEVMAIGDSTNDIPLFQNAKLKIAMGNATKAIKEQADFITNDVNNQGVTKAIEKFCLK